MIGNRLSYNTITNTFNKLINTSISYHFVLKVTSDNVTILETNPLVLFNLKV